MTALTRRRFLTIAGAATAGGLAGWPASALGGQPYVWRGAALGARAEIRLHLDDPSRAAAIVELCRAEIERLEQLFSLYRPASAISRLNRDGYLDDPDGDFLSLLATSRNVHRATGGLFDPTIQPLWEDLAHTYSDGSGPRRPLTIGFDDVAIGANRIAFDRPGMALTFNGIAQGYITDRVADLLRANGVNDTLVNIGELRALGGRPDGWDWPVRIAGSATVVALRDGALATSATAGTTFDPLGQVSHIVNPISRSPAPIGQQISVAAPSATLADALSTAFVMMDEPAVREVASGFAGVRIVGPRVTRPA